MRVRFTQFDAKKPILFHMLLQLLGLLILLTAILAFFFGMSRVSGNSMLPGLKNGEIVVYARNVKSYERRDIVAVRMASGEMVIKRILGLPGDVISLENGAVFVNGVEETGGYAIGYTEVEVESIKYPFTVEEGRYYILGDNREVSIDSRTYGTVGRSQLLGRVMQINLSK